MKDFSHSVKFPDAMIKYIDSQNHEPNKFRGYVGASQLGGCGRMLTMLGRFPAKPHDPRILRIFDRGHWGEIYVAKYLNESGIIIKTHNDDGKQFGFVMDTDGIMRGHIDGIIQELSDAFKKFADDHPNLEKLQVPALWENKIPGKKMFGDIKRKKLKRANRIYYSQIQLYMAYMAITHPELAKNPALFSILSTDTMEFHFELIYFDLAYAQRISDKGLRIIEARKRGELIPRSISNSNHQDCVLCDYRGPCWDKKNN